MELFQIVFSRHLNFLDGPSDWHWLGSDEVQVHHVWVFSMAVDSWAVLKIISLTAMTGRCRLSVTCCPVSVTGAGNQYIYAEPAYCCSADPLNFRGENDKQSSTSSHFCLEVLDCSGLNMHSLNETKA